METWKRAAMPALAAAGVLAVGLLLSRGRPPAIVEQGAPSGRVYRLLASAPVEFAGGGRGLGVRYLAESSDRARQIVEADELMTLVSAAAEKAGLRVIVIEAVRKKPWGSSSSKAGFGRGPDGVWRRLSGKLADEPAPDPADLRALDEAYARIERAVETKDLRELAAVQAPEFWHRLKDGSRRTREEENLALAASLKAVARIAPVLRISQISVSGSYAVVVASMTSTGSLAGGGQRFKSLTVSRDTWIKGAEGWRLALSSDVDDRFELLRR